MNSLRFWCFVWFAGVWGTLARPASAHPMGNFSINHYARFGVGVREIKLRYILDFAEIPAAERMTRLDANGDGRASDAEKAAFLKTEAPTFLGGLSLKVNGQALALALLSSDLEVRPGAGGLPTLRVWMDARAPLPSASTLRVEYNDANFEGRTGWMEILALPEKGCAVRDSDAGSVDRSRGLTVFPLDAGTVAPRQSSAAFTVVPSDAASASASAAPPPSAPTSNDNTPQNRFTQSIAEGELTPALVAWGVLFALGFGAVHALSPGHGKTMVAAYLVGTRGTPRHAVLLGLVVTITHTLGVFALGFALLFASRSILPEKLFPALSALSGMLIFGVGLWLFLSRWQALTAPGHTHSHDDHTHENGGHTHSHGGHIHSHAVPEGPLTMRSLVALGISGGIVPCPEALVVLLAAVKLHRIGYGMVLISAFSLGLAAALVAIGLLVVSARGRLSRVRGLDENSALVRWLPVGSAAIITLIGAILTLRASMGAF